MKRIRLTRILLFLVFGPSLWWIMMGASIVDLVGLAREHDLPRWVVDFIMLLWLCAQCGLVWSILFWLPERRKRREGADP
ncbi:MAG: hypothetical protein JXQ73_30095 [Phycisphaerae bacterium]|nr:hypothetical protein [Phycisphaerae bacterium]